MGRMVDGEWYTAEEMIEHSESGEFERTETTFRNWVGGGPPGGEEQAEADRFPVESGRYHLYVSYACPWAHRALLTRALKGLEDQISVDVVDPHRVDQGWEFDPDKPGCTPDTQNGHDYLRDVYAEAEPDYTGRVTVPVLWDTERETIVNNESEEIIKMLDRFDGDRDVTLYPADRREEIDEVIDDIYPAINNGVYRAGFADTQAAYDRAVDDLFAALGRYDDLLADQRYLVGDRLTLADVCMFTTLYRFDEVYHTHFKCNRREITDCDHLWPYLRDLYRLPGVAGTCHMDHVKEHYYRSHEHLNPKGIVPAGPNPDFGAPHDRDDLPGEPPAALREVAGTR